MPRTRVPKDIILDRTAKIASSVGLQALTIGGLAKAVGMSKSGLFAHFSSKENLQLKVLKFAADTFTQSVLAPAIKEPRGEPRVRAIFENWVKYLKDSSSSPGARILISASIELDDQPGNLRDFVYKAQVDFMRNIERAARIAIEEGHFDANMDVEQFSWNVYSLALGYHHFRKMLEPEKVTVLLAESFERLLNQVRRK